MTVKSESKDKKHKVRSLDDIIFPFLIGLVFFFLLLAAFIMDEELLDKWNIFLGSAILGWWAAIFFVCIGSKFALP